MKKVIIAIVAALVLTGVGVTLFFMLRGGDEEKPTDGADRADIADITDLSGIADKVDIDDLTSIINGETRDNAKEESQTDVIVTVNGGTELNLTGDVGEVIRKVSDDNGLIYNGRIGYVLDYDIKTNNIFIPSGDNGDISKIIDKKDYYLGIASNKYGGGIVYTESSCSGELKYIFYQNKNDKERLIIDRISLLDGWTGKISEIDYYLNEKYSIIYPENDDKMSDARIVLFRDGKLIPVDEIINEYGEEAERIIIDYEGSLLQYYQDNKNIDIDEARKFMCGSVGDFRYSMAKNSMLGVGYSDESGYIYSKDAPTYPALHLEICMQLAMNDWAAEDDGNLKKYGCISWKADGYEDLYIYVHCTHEDFLRISDPYRENKDGELTPPHDWQ